MTDTKPDLAALGITPEAFEAVRAAKRTAKARQHADELLAELVQAHHIISAMRVLLSADVVDPLQWSPTMPKDSRKRPTIRLDERRALIARAGGQL